jgi:1,4-dihydroxy-2-naphthoate octaprenyltransferase
MIYPVIIILTVLILITIAGYCNGVMDYIKMHNLDSESWKNKWEWIITENGEERQPYIKQWYYLGLYSPAFKEEYPFSSTILVFLTDEWHSEKWTMFLMYEFIISTGFVCYENLDWWLVPVGIIILKTVRGLGFTLKYDKK